MDKLPDELLVEIFRFIPRNKLLSTLIKVNRRWRRLSFSPCLWREFDLNTDCDKKSWNDEFMSEIFSCVRKLNVTFGILNTQECLRVLEENTFSNVQDLQINTIGSHRLLPLLWFTKDIPSIRSLHLSFRECFLKDLPNALAHLQTIKSISIDHLPTAVSGPHASTICRFCYPEHWLNALKSLNLHKMEEISLRTDNLDDETLQLVLNLCRNLSAITLDSLILLTNDCFENVTRNPTLKSIQLCRMQIDDRSMLKLVNYAPGLKRLMVHGDVNSLTHRGIELLCEQYDMETLSIKNSAADPVKISDVILDNIGAKWSSLQNLCLWFFEEITDSGIEAVVNGCPCIQSIDLLNAFNLTDASLLAMANRSKFLKKVYFRSTEDSRCLFYRHIHNVGFQELIYRRKNMEEVLFEGFENLFNISFNYSEYSSLPEYRQEYSKPTDLVKSRKGKLTTRGRLSKVKKSVNFENSFAKTANHSHLQRVTFERCHRLDDDSVYELLQFCPDIRYLNIDLCNNVSMSVVIRATNMHQNLTIRRL